MYVPRAFVETDDTIVVSLVRSAGFGHLVCVGPDGLTSTPLPFVVDDALTSVRAHLARPNQIWRSAPCAAVLIVPVSDAYISPSWYPSKHDGGDDQVGKVGKVGKVVPTWNYEVVHLHGQLELHDDLAWVRQQIGDLTDQQEASLPEPWSVHDAPPGYITAMAAGIVGIELHVERVEAKRKLSQNRSDADRAGAIDGLRRRIGRRPEIADAMDRSGA